MTREPLGAAVLGAVGVALSSGAMAAPPTLTAADVERVIGQAVAQAEHVGLPVTIAVVDREGNVLGLFEMAGAQTDIMVSGAPRDLKCQAGGLEDCLIKTLPPVPTASTFAAISKAGTAAFFSTQGNAFSTRSAAFIIQQHFPPGVTNTSSGPLFGVQFSQLPCGDVNPKLPLGLSGDTGGVPLYKRGRAVGGLGVEGDGKYTADLDPSDGDVTKEETIAIAATRGFPTPSAIRGDRILINGLRLPFLNTELSAVPPRGRPDFASLRGTVLMAPRDSPASQFRSERLRGLRGTVDPRFFPPRDSLDPTPPEGLTSAEVLRVLTQGARQAFKTRAGIRRPLGDVARVNITVVDRAGNILGIFRTKDAPTFGFDVSAQKARTAAFMSKPGAGAALRAAGQEEFVTAAAADGIFFDGRIAFSDRGIGFIARPFFPDGIDSTRHGPLSRPASRFSVFNDGLQIELVGMALAQILGGGPPPADCTGVPGIPNGTQIFPGSVPLYRNGTLIGAAGVSGDGVDQDDIIATKASRGFEAPSGMRSDRVQVRGVRLPFVKFPRNPTDL